jgi:hypothetical protein
MHHVTNPISRFEFGALLGLSLHLVTHPNGYFGFVTPCMSRGRRDALAAARRGPRSAARPYAEARAMTRGRAARPARRLPALRRGPRDTPAAAARGPRDAAPPGQRARPSPAEPRRAPRSPRGTQATAPQGRGPLAKRSPARRLGSRRLGLPRDSRRRRGAAADQIGRPLGDHDRRRVGVAAHERRHHRGVDDAQRLKSEHP